MTHESDPKLRALIYPHTGEVTDVRPAERGFRSDVTAVFECEKGPFFVKAMRNEGWRRVSITCERLINPFVQPISPAVMWATEDDNWAVLGFEVVDGRRANFKPDSPDLPIIVELLNRIGELELPEVAEDWHEKRWDRFATDEAEAESFRGDALLHMDINPSNLLIGSPTAWVVDWSGASRGAAFIDPAMLVVQLVSAGHTPEAAESWVAPCKAWSNADPKAVDAFAIATVRMWRTMADGSPDEPWLLAIAEAAESWANHRGLVVTAM